MSGVDIKDFAQQDDAIAPAELSAIGQDASQALVDRAKGTCKALQVKKVLHAKHSLSKWKELTMPYDYEQDIDGLLATPFGTSIGQLCFCGELHEIKAVLHKELAANTFPANGLTTMRAERSWPPEGVKLTHPMEETYAQFTSGMLCVCNVEPTRCKAIPHPHYNLRVDGGSLWGLDENGQRFWWKESVKRFLACSSLPILQMDWCCAIMGLANSSIKHSHQLMTQSSSSVMH